MASSVNGADDLVRDLLAGAKEVTPLLQVAVDGSAVKLKDATQQHATGRPGPYAPTRDYIESWRSGPKDESDRERQPGEEIAAASVYTDAAQGHRLEFGWVGTDSKGRHVVAPPYPHLSPAIDETRPVFDAAVEAALKKAVDW